MLTFEPFISRSLRRAGFDAHYTRHAVRSWELEPACSSPRQAAIFDEDDLRRVTHPAPHTALETQFELIRAGRYSHPARLVRLYRDVVMVDGHLFTMRMVHPMAHRRMPGVSTNRLERVAAGVLGTSEYGNKYFGHWLSDDVPMSRTAERFGEVYGHVNADNRLIGHQPDYARILDWNIRLVENVRFGELTILDWSPMTPYQAERYAEMRNRLLSDPDAPRKPGVMLLRQGSGQQRVLDNELQIAELVRGRGFQVLDPVRSSVAELVAACANAEVLIGVEGSHLAHGFLPLAPGGAVLTLQPPFKFDHFWKSRCDCIGARYAFIVGTRTAQASYTVDLDQVQRMLDRLA